MNKREIYINKQNTLNEIKKTSLTGTKIGCSKAWKGVTYEHYKVMSDIVWKLTNENYEVFTEVEFVNGKGRADIVAIDTLGNGIVIEVLHSESEMRLEAKKDYYPFPIYKVNTKDFNINNWDL